ncbi:MAG: MBL fold metallo-hydrolase [Bdellovibrionota bacterium]
MTTQIRFHWLEGGHCRHMEKSTYREGSFKTRAYPSFFGVLEHPTEGLFLFDTGYSPRFEEATKSFPEKLYALMTPVTCSPEDTCQHQLKQRGFSERDVKGIFISHFHADHVAALHYFPHSRIYFAGNGLRRMEALVRLRQVTNGFLPGLLPEDIWKRAVLLEDAKPVSLPKILSPFTDGFDLLGDGSLLAVPLEGHMSGHTGLYFRSQKGPVLLVADSVWHSDSYRKLVPPIAAARLLMHDWDTYQRTLHSLHKIWKREKELHLVPSHCTDFRGVFLG